MNLWTSDRVTNVCFSGAYHTYTKFYNESVIPMYFGSQILKEQAAPFHVLWCWNVGKLMLKVISTY